MWKGNEFYQQPVSLEENLEPQMRMATLDDTLISAKWKSEQRIQPHHTGLLFYRNWDDKFILFKVPVLVVVCYTAIEN